jgi:AraC family transcriptional regulator
MVPDTAPDWLRRATKLVHERFRERLFVPELAEAVAVRPAHFTVVFREVHGLSIGRYIRRLRVRWAAEQLVATDTPVAAVAIEAGFADQAHLTRCFRTETGTTPAAFRRVRGRWPARPVADPRTQSGSLLSRGR